jgi:LacI family transcriptional regulator
LEERLRSGDRPDAFLVLQDLCAPTVVEAALRAGLRLPRDLKMATIDNGIDLTVDGVGLTSAAFDWDSLAKLAVSLLLDRLGSLHRPSATRTAPHSLVVKGLCGAPRAEWTDDGPANRESGSFWNRPKPQFVYSTGYSATHNQHLSRSGEIIK